MEVSVNKSSTVSFFNNNLSRKRVMHLMVLFALASALFLAMMHGCWAEGKDLLKPGDETVKATFGKDSSIMTWLLIGEVVTAIVAYVATKNIKVLFGVIVLSVFISIAAAVIGL
ncbi:conjugal transfer protein TraA [Salmonella enterica]|nr:conjugal transfer protein TraA [Salmonella enterica]